MATERQKAANRRNARKSTGPRWNGGKRRASRNSFRHGLSRPAALGKADEEWIERFARAAIKGCRSAVTLELGRSAACAQLELGRIGQVRAAIIEGLNSDLERYGSRFDWFHKMVHKHFPRHARKWLDLLDDPQARLDRLDRYERRAVSRRDRALRAIIAAGEGRS